MLRLAVQTVKFLTAAAFVVGVTWWALFVAFAV